MTARGEALLALVAGVLQAQPVQATWFEIDREAAVDAVAAAFTYHEGHDAFLAANGKGYRRPRGNRDEHARIVRDTLLRKEVAEALIRYAEGVA